METSSEKGRFALLSSGRRSAGRFVARTSVHSRRHPVWSALMVMVLAAASLVIVQRPEAIKATSDIDPYQVPQVVDINPDPNIVETTIIADELAIADIGDGRNVTNAMAYNGSIPGPEFRLQVGDTVRVHFINNLDEEFTGIHWHGIELANASDGTQFVQNQVEPGETFLYEFQVPRPGVYWYHPHHHFSTNQVVKGLYGSMIVEDPNEAALIAGGVLPPAANTHTVQVSDLTICKAPGSNDAVTYDPTLPHVSGGALPAQGNPHPDDICELAPLDNEGAPMAGDYAAGEIANIQPAGGQIVNEGQTVMTNGMVVGGRAGTPAAPGALEAGARTLDITPGEGLRLQLISPMQVRYLRFRLTDSNGVQIPLVRIGGEGGLLNEAILDGGTAAPFDFKYDPGEIVLGPSERADVVAAIPPTATGVATLWTQDFQRFGTGFSNTPTVPVAHYNVTGTPGTYDIQPGADLRIATGDTIDVIGAGGIDDVLNPADFGKPGMGNDNLTLGLFNINGVVGEHDLNGDYTVNPKPNSARWAAIGDTIEFSVQNTSGLHHPFHMHGFSFQPVTLVNGGSTFTYPPEFVDSVDIPPNAVLTYRFVVEDRPQMDGTTAGGGLGRWFFHCHIFFHAVAGMMSELVITDANGNERPYVDLLETIIAAEQGDIATATGKVMDPDGDAVALTVNIGSVQDNGDGTWTWTHNTAGNPVGRQNIYVTGTDTNGNTGQIAFDLDLEAAGPDTTPPVITLDGADPQNVVINTAYTELGATATDNVDGVFAVTDIDASAVDITTLGSYDVTYNAIDVALNAAIEVTRTVNVIDADETPPVITLVGDSTVTVVQGDPYVDDGATASDNVDGNLTSEIVTVSNVNTAIVGTYQVTYDVEDDAGNDAVRVVRTVVVEPDSTVLPGTEKPNRIFVTNVIQSGPAEYSFLFGDTSEEILTGDWNGNGHDGFARRKANSIVEVDERGNAIRSVTFGQASDTLYRVGDWDGDGTDTLAVQRGNVFHVTNSPTAAGPATAIGYGRAGDEVFVGDWDGDGVDTFAVRRGNVFYVRNSVTTGVADVVFGYGRAGDEVLIGDWDNDGTDTFAVRRGNVIFIRNDFMTGVAETVIGYGRAADDLLVGDWNGDLVDTFAVRRPETT